MKNILLIFLTLALQTTATIRYVKASNLTPIPPYTSWATASDSIQKCINVCVPGDTIYLSEGVFKEQVFMIPGLSIIGNGMINTIIDCATVVPQGSTRHIIFMQDSSSITDLTLRVAIFIPTIDAGINANHLIKVKVKNIFFDYVRYPLGASDAVISNSIFYFSNTTLTSASIERPYQIDFYNNYLIYVGYEVYLSGNTNGQPCKVDLHNNVITLGEYGQIMDNGWSSLFTTYL